MSVVLTTAHISVVALAILCSGGAQESVREFRVSGGHTARVTPVPIPNTEVKPRRADDTARATVSERRSPPGLNYKEPSSSLRAPLFVLRPRFSEDLGVTDK